jgi:Transcriptional regulator
MVFRVADKDQIKAEMVQKIQEYILTKGFSNLKMEDIAKIMTVSRAKLYQYFSSKEEVIAEVVAKYVNFIKTVEVPTELDEKENFINEFPNFFYQNLALWGTTTDLFIDELNKNYPNLYLDFTTKLKERNKQVEAFFEAGKNKGVFYEHLNSKLIILQDRAMISRLIDKSYLFENGLTYEHALKDYFLLLVTEVFVPELSQEVMKADIQDRLQHFIVKFNRIY